MAINPNILLPSKINHASGASSHNKNVITIPDYRAKSRNRTVTAHWRTYQKYRDEIADLIQAYAKNREDISFATVIIEAYYKGKRSIDTSNLDDKMIVDGLMKVGILKNDTALEDPEVIKRVYPSSGHDSLVISIIKNKSRL